MPGEQDGTSGALTSGLCLPLWAPDRLRPALWGDQRWLGAEEHLVFSVSLLTSSLEVTIPSPFGDVCVFLLSLCFPSLLSISAPPSPVTPWSSCFPSRRLMTCFFDVVEREEWRVGVRKVLFLISEPTPPSCGCNSP